MACLRFERALRTRGNRDHMQVHILPLPLSPAQLSRCLGVFMEKISTEKLKFSELQDERPVDEVVVTMEGGPYQEYFYLELPTALQGDVTKHRRFVFVREEKAAQPFPMQFGLELAAAIMEQPERGHWKHNLLEEAEEVTLVEEFRQKFEPFDFTLQDS